MPIAPMPEDLRQRVESAVASLDQIEERLSGLEPILAQVKILRHDFNSARQIILLLMTEIEQRLPIKK